MASPSAAPPTWDDIFGGLLVGAFLVIALWGMSCIQAYVYVTHYNQDRLFFKLSVGLIILLNTASTTMLAHVPYYYLITNYANPVASSRFVWTEAVGEFVAEILNFIIRLLFARRVWLLSKGNLWMTGVIWLFAISALAFAIAGVTVLLGVSDPTVILTGGGKYIAIRRMYDASFAIQLLAELSVTVTMCYCLSKSRTGFAKTDSVINTLMKYMFNTGFLVIVTSVVAFCFLHALPRSTWASTPYCVTSKLYVNSYLAMLNARESLFVGGINSIPMNPSSFDTTSGTVSAFDSSKNKIVVLQTTDRSSDRDHDVRTQVSKTDAEVL